MPDDVLRAAGRVPGSARDPQRPPRSHTASGMSKPSTNATEVIDWSCLRCDAPLEDRGEVRFREGGTGGLGHLILGNLADLGEGLLTVRVLGCARCGELAFVDPEFYPG
jgi:hypothetical protein